LIGIIIYQVATKGRDIVQSFLVMQMYKETLIQIGCPSHPKL